MANNNASNNAISLVSKYEDVVIAQAQSLKMRFDSQALNAANTSLLSRAWMNRCDSDSHQMSAAANTAETDQEWAGRLTGSEIATRKGDEHFQRWQVSKHDHVENTAKSGAAEERSKTTLAKLEEIRSYAFGLTAANEEDFSAPHAGLNNEPKQKPQPQVSVPVFGLAA
jgi:hypothetical protein